MKKLGIILCMLAITTLGTWAQGAKSIRITEVMTQNRTSIVDEYGNHKPWVEISNSSFTTYNVRGMFLTTNRRVLDKKMSPEERRKLMSPLPNNEPRTTIAGKKSIVIFDKNDAQAGALHLSLGLQPKKANWIAIYDGNAVDLIDSVSVPALLTDQSYELSRDFKQWSKSNYQDETPGYLPQAVGLSKSQQLKKTDPYGIGIAVLSMGIVFSCLALLFIVFWLFGNYMKHKQRLARATEKHATLLYNTGKKTIEVTNELSHKTNVMLKDGLSTKGIDKETYIAVISLALKEYLEDVHDIESGIITIKPKQTRWNEPRF